MGDLHLGPEALQEVEVEGQVVYSVNVQPDWEEAPGCGTPGRQVTFQVDSLAMSPAAAWDSRRLWQLDLEPALDQRDLYLPLILK